MKSLFICQSMIHTHSAETLHSTSTILPTVALNVEESTLNLILGCLRCEDTIEDFKRTGRWRESTIGATYELFRKISGTLTNQPVLATARDDADEFGEWDEWTQPLVDVSSIITAIIRLSVTKSKVVFATEAIIYDSIGFITAQPRKVGGLHKLP